MSLIVSQFQVWNSTSCCGVSSSLRGVPYATLDVRDRAQVFANGQAIGIVERWSLPASKDGNGKTTFTFKVEDEVSSNISCGKNTHR